MRGLGAWHPAAGAVPLAAGGAGGGVAPAFDAFEARAPQRRSGHLRPDGGSRGHDELWGHAGGGSPAAGDLRGVWANAQSADLGGGGPDVVHCGAGGSCSLEQRYLVPEQSPQRAAGFREQAVAGHRAGALHAGPRQEQELRTPQLAEAVRDGAGPGDLGPAGDDCSTATPR